MYLDLICHFLLLMLLGFVTGDQFSLFTAMSDHWSGAKAHCESINKVLARVDSADKQKWVEYLSHHMNGNFWLGLRGDEESQTYTWVDGSPLKYTNWQSTREIGYSSDAECVVMRSDTFKWEVFNCTQQLNFLCEDPYYKRSKVVTEETKIKGLMFGLVTIGGLLVLVCLLVNLPCCRVNVSDKIAFFGLGTKDPDQVTLTT